MSRIYDQFVKKILNSMEEEQTVAWAVSRAGELQRMCLDEMPYNHGLAFNHMAKKWVFLIQIHLVLILLV